MLSPTLGDNRMEQRTERHPTGDPWQNEKQLGVCFLLTPRVRGVLQHRWEGVGKPEEGWVWPASTKSEPIEPCSLKKQHRRALGQANIRPFVLYSLRHTFLTRLGESGCDAWTLASIAGHSSIGISARYVHPSEDAVLRAVERLGGHKTKTR